jgi:hypothetical protein
MTASMILGIDGAVQSGWALGAPGSIPRVGVQRLKKPNEDTWLVADGAARFLRDICFIESTRPDLIAIEALMPNFNSGDDRERQVQRSAASMLTPPLIMGAVRGIAACYGIDVVQVYPATWRKHFLGRSNFGSREETKRQTLMRCSQLGYLPVTCKDDNQADACGVWDWAAAVHGRAVQPLVLFDEGRLRHG